MIGGTPDAAYPRAEFSYSSAVYDVICRAAAFDAAQSAGLPAAAGFAKPLEKIPPTLEISSDLPDFGI